MSTKAIHEQSHRVDKYAEVDPELAATRRLKASADKYYEPEIDIDWAAPVVAGRPWLSEHRSYLAGTGLWKRLTERQRTEFGKQQFGTTLLMGIWAESALGIFLYHDLMVSPPTSGRTRYLLTQIGEETRHSAMFARVVEKMGEDSSSVSYRVPRFIRGTVPLLSALLPVDAAYVGILMAEEALDRQQREGMNDPALQPHARTAMRIHVIEEARHEAFAKEEIVRRYSEAGHLGRFLMRVTAPLVALVGPMLILANPQMYRAVGISPARGMLTAFVSKQYRVNGQFLFGPISRFFYEAGLIKGFPAVSIWRLSRGLSDDVNTAIKDNHRRRQSHGHNSAPSELAA